jgi:hypothetical protein
LEQSQMKNVVLLGVGVLALGLGGCDQLFKVSSPQRKPGLWQQTLQSDRMPTPIVTKWCFDAASDRQIPVFGRRQRRSGPMAAACSKMSTSKNGDSYVMDTQCSFGGATITNHSVISGDFTAKYTVVRTTNVTGSPDPTRNGDHKSSETWAYQGACPQEIAAGNVQLPNGDVVPMASLRGGRGGSGGGGGGPGGGGGAGGPGGGGGGGGPPPG